MQHIADSKGSVLSYRIVKSKWVLNMLLLCALVSGTPAMAKLNAQTVTLQFTEAPLRQLVETVQAQTHYRFVYIKDLETQVNPVTMHVVNSPLREALQLYFSNQPVDFVLEDRVIILRHKKTTAVATNYHDVKGKVINENDEPLAGISVRLLRSNNATVTDGRGEFVLANVTDTSVLEITGAEIDRMEIPVAARIFINIKVSTRVSSLDGVVVMAYGQTTQRLNTGNIAKVTAEEIDRQPVSNPLATLEGKVPGMIVTQSSGVAGSAFKVQIRGRTTLDPLLSRNDPLFIIDGMPFEPGNLASNQLLSAANQPYNASEGGLSPLNTINPADIQSIEVLKDADATSIYGSRGANGVVLITTKKARAGQLQVQLSAYYGNNKATRLPQMMNTQQYVAMRREAFANDNRPITATSAPDLLRWDTTQHTDYSRFVKHAAHTYDAQLSVSAAGANTSFMLSGGFHRETSVFASNLADARASLRMHVAHNSADKKFNLNFGAYYVADNNKTIQGDLTQYMPLPPHFNPYDSLGNPNFTTNGTSIVNTTNFGSTPVADLLKQYESRNEYVSANLQMSYAITPAFLLMINTGYNVFNSAELQGNPKASVSPLFLQQTSSAFGHSKNTSWIAEPQLQYARESGNHKLVLLAGATLQQSTQNADVLNAYGFSSDLLMYSPAAAATLMASRNFSQYRYSAAFGRLTYNYNSKYIFNGTLRRDGSSRFGPGNRFSTFGSVAGAWLFSNEKFFRNRLPWLSYGKLRASYGTSGNDQVGDYRYLDLWDIQYIPYDGITGLSPSTLYNPDYHWEINRKLEIALETGFWKDRVMASVAFYRNRSSNQLINYQLPIQSGFYNVVANLPALVENRGWELTLQTKNIDRKIFRWSTSFNLTLPVNVLRSFPGLASSSYATIYSEGKSLTTYRTLHSLGVNPQTGVYEFTDENKDGQISSPMDYTFRGNLDPKLYGGLQNSFQFKQWRLDVMLEGRNQPGVSYIGALPTGNVGQVFNLPVMFLDHWQKEGDMSNVQKLSTTYASDAGMAGAYLRRSDARYTDASYIRLKTVSLSLLLEHPRLYLLTPSQLRIFCNAQNLFVITPYKGADPETQRFYVLPPMRCVSAGIQVTF